MPMSRTLPNFWKWFFFGTGGLSGWRRLVAPGLIFHVAAGFFGAMFIPANLKEISAAVLLPLASVFVGLTFAWVANVQAVLQSDEVFKLGQYKDGGFEDFVFPFQLGVLIILVCLVVWGLAGLGVFESVVALGGNSAAQAISNSTQKLWVSFQAGDGVSQFFDQIKVFWVYFIIKATLLATVSLSIRECWHMIGASMMLLILRRKMQQDHE
jgi:hypothetical protein